jgi:hypothetical protein
MRFKFCERLPADHPFQPPMIEPLSFVPADADVIGEHVGSESANISESSSSHPTPMNQTLEPSILENLVSHYSGELPGVEPNSEKASEITSMEVVLEEPPQQQPAQRPQSPNQTQHVPEPEVTMVAEPSSTHIGETLSPALPYVLKRVDDPPSVSICAPVVEKITSTSTTTVATDIPSSSNLAIQPCAPF